MDYEIRSFQDQLIQLINEQKLPWEVRRLVLSDVYDLVLKKSNEVIEHQLIEKCQKEVDDAESVFKNKLEKLPNH